MAAPSAGTRLGPYELLNLLGSGGMGTVWKARDTRLDRLVAVKLSTAHFSERFDREARAIAALNDPHICQLYDVGPNYLVMELIEGQPLHGPLALDTALTYAGQICQALEAAHRHGIVHRDLKPANILVTKSGIKLLDFGLAKLSPSSPLTGELDSTAALTGDGVLLGTLPYMSPEQVEGKSVDHRTDIFSFGLVLYEMLTGCRAFEASSPASLIGAILHTEPPPLTSRAPVMPPLLERIVTACLAKDPEARWQSAQDLHLALMWLTTSTGSSAPVPVGRKRGKLAFVTGLALLLALVAGAIYDFRPTPQPVSHLRASLLPPVDRFFQRGQFSVSPDGTRLAFVAVEPDGTPKLWVRAFSSATAQALNGSEGAMMPFWAPDSRRIGFIAGGKLKTTDLGSGAVRILCDAPLGRVGAGWNRNGTIVFSPSITGPLYRISDSGGTPLAVTQLARAGSGQRHAWPQFLPDGKHFLYAVQWSTPGDPQRDGLYVGSLDNSPPRLISADLAGNVAFAAGHLLYEQDRSLRAQPFDITALQLRGGAVSIAEQEVESDPGFAHAEFSVSDTGVLVFQSLSDSVSRLTWFDASGKELGEVGESGYRDPRLSPNGQFLAVSADDTRTGKFVIRVFDVARGVALRLTDGSKDESPVWSPDGRQLAYSSFDGHAYSINTVPADGSQAPQPLLRGDAVMRHLDWSSAGSLVFTDFSLGLPAMKVYTPANRQLLSLRRGAEARFSPDGRWLAHGSATGLVVEPYPGPGGRLEISRGAGAQPVWARDGRQIYYIASDRRLMAVSFDAQRQTAGAPRVLFQTRIIAPNFYGTQYDVSADGRFLINSVPASHSSPLTFVSGWTALLAH